MTGVVVAYIPVLHDGYRRFIEDHGVGKVLYVIGPELYADYRPLAKDIRCLDAGLVASAVDSWRICNEVSVLTEAGAVALDADRPSITLPAEDISYRIVDRWFPRCQVRYDAVFLRWDKTKAVQLLRPSPADVAELGTVFPELRAAAESAATGSIDWWRQVGAAIRFADGEVRAATNEHFPHRMAPYAAGDPRSNFFKGVHYDISTVLHAEARLIGEAARDGVSTVGSEMYVTDFPCPLCAKLVAAAGVVTLYFRQGYAMLDGEEVLAAAGVKVIEVT